jgi:hypothetical protein
MDESLHKQPQSTENSIWKQGGMRNLVEERSVDAFPSLDESSISSMESKDSNFYERPLFDESYVSIDPFYSFSAEELTTKTKVDEWPTKCTCDDFMSLSLKLILVRIFDPLSDELDESFSSK